MTPDNSLFGSTGTSMRKSSVAETVGTHVPRPMMYTRGSSPMMGPSLTSLRQARTSPLRWPCFMAETPEGHVESVSEEETTPEGNPDGRPKAETVAPSHVRMEQLRARKLEIDDAGQQLV